MSEWGEEEQRIERALNTPIDSFPSRVLSAKRIIELANKAYFLYLTQKPHEQAKLLKLVLLNCSIDGVSLYPSYRKPFDIIFQRAKTKEWSACYGVFEPGSSITGIITTVQPTGPGVCGLTLSGDPDAHSECRRCP